MFMFLLPTGRPLDSGAAALCLVLLTVSTFSVWKPSYNTDMVPYIAIAAGCGTYEQTYKATLAELRRIPNASYRQLASSPLFDTPERLAEQMPFYSVKPLYVGLVSVIGATGVGLARATFLVSILAYWILGFILWRWVGVWSIGVLLCPPLIGIVRMSTPDCLAASLLLGGVYFLKEKRTGFGCLLVIFAIWSRPDAVIFAGLLLLGLLLVGRLSWPAFTALSAASIFSYFIINRIAGAYSWSTLFYNSFVGAMSDPADRVLHVTLHMYAAQFVKGMLDLEVQDSIFLLAAFIAVIAWTITSDRFQRMLLLASVGAVAIHFAFFPGFVTRMFAPMLLTIGVTALDAIQTDNRVRRDVHALICSNLSGE